MNSFLLEFRTGCTTVASAILELFVMGEFPEYSISIFSASKYSHGIKFRTKLKTQGDRIRHVLQSLLGLTQRQIEQDTGCQQSSLSKIYNNVQEPSQLLLTCLKMRYGVNVEWVKKGVGDPLGERCSTNINLFEKYPQLLRVLSRIDIKDRERVRLILHVCNLEKKEVRVLHGILDGKPTLRGL